MTNKGMKTLIVQKIRQEGFITFADYMDTVLSHPLYGYYMTRDPFGQGGDFTTAPEVSQMFGEMVGVWVADLWQKMGSPECFNLVECGAGRGTLMKDVWRATSGVKGFYAAASVHFVEISPVLRQKQKENTAHIPGVRWHNSIDTIPRDAMTIVIGNEFLDALPVHQVVYSQTGWQEKCVGLSEEGRLIWTQSPASDGLEPYLPRTAKIGDVYECSPAQAEFIANCASFLKGDSVGGATLFFDYGYVVRGAGDTVQAVHRHQFCDVLEYVGDADITAHVDFSFVKKVAESQGLSVFGAVEQGVFLRELGIQVRAEKLKETVRKSSVEPDRAAHDIDLALERLTGRKQMGCLFKAIAMLYTPQGKIQPAGFSHG